LKQLKTKILFEMRVLVSVVDASEALEALAGGADIIDVKDPSRGSLGAPSKHRVLEVKLALPPTATVSAALGDDPRSREVLSLAREASKLGLSYIKAGSLGLKSVEEATEVYRAIKSMSGGVEVVAVAYADFSECGCLSPMEVLEAAYKSDLGVFMIDTYKKDGRSTFDHLSEDYLVEVRRAALSRGMTMALAGSLKLRHVEKVFRVNPHIVGFRGAVCEGGRLGRVSRRRVEELVSKYRVLSLSLCK